MYVAQTQVELFLQGGRMEKKPRTVKVKSLCWDPDEVIVRPAQPAIVPLTEEEQRRRAGRFVWKPGDLRRVLPPPKEDR
jgi:hypothetical protein